MKIKTKVVIGQLGSPKTPEVGDVRKYLRKFLGDPRVVDINPWVWKIILNCFVLPFRPYKSAKAYARIWDGEEFPLTRITRDFTNLLEGHLEENIEINHGFILSRPYFHEILEEWAKEDVVTRANKVLILPQFPQYAEATVASAIDEFAKVLGGTVTIPSFEFVNYYHHSKAFIDNSVRFIENHFREQQEKGEVIDQLVLSFHGIPTRRVTKKKDPYYQQCYETFVLIRDRVKCIAPEKVHMTFQSRFGREVWLLPSTDDYVFDLAKENKTISVYCPSFVVDCLETIDEIGTELNEEVEELGAKVLQVPCLNDDPDWAKDYAHFINVYVNGTQQDKENLYYQLDHKYIHETLPELKLK